MSLLTSPLQYTVVVKALFYASFRVILLAVFIAMLIKSWVREFDRGLRAGTTLEQRATAHEFSCLGIEYWKPHEVVVLLPSFILITLLLLAIGLVLFLFHISKPSFRVTTGIFGIGVTYVLCNHHNHIGPRYLLAFLHSSVVHLRQIVPTCVCIFLSNLELFFSPSMDTTLVTTWVVLVDGSRFPFDSDLRYKFSGGWPAR